MTKLSGSYATTLDYLEDGDMKGAASEYRNHFVPAMKKLYSEAAEVYPVRFEKIDEWCVWTKRVYIFTRKAEQLFRKIEKGEEVDPNEVRKYLLLLREYFRSMHEEAQRLRANDYVFAFYKELLADDVSAAKLKEIRAALDGAKPSMKIEASPGAYEKAKTEWVEAVDPVLSKGTLNQEELAELRRATKPFYREFGLHFE